MQLQTSSSTSFAINEDDRKNENQRYRQTRISMEPQPDGKTAEIDVIESDVVMIRGELPNSAMQLDQQQ
jgi:hypothetical protein